MQAASWVGLSSTANVLATANAAAVETFTWNSSELRPPSHEALARAPLPPPREPLLPVNQMSPMLQWSLMSQLLRGTGRPGRRRQLNL